MHQPPEYPGNPPGYGPPPGAYPPPPGYGPPPGAYPPPPGYGPPLKPGFSIGAAINWSWNRFTQNAVAFVIPVLVYAGALAAVIGGMIALVINLSDRTTVSYTDVYGSTAESMDMTMTPAASITMLVGYVALFVVVMYLHAGLTTGCLDIADGKPVTIGTFFKPRNLGRVLLTGLLVVMGMAIGSALCIIPGLVFGFFAQFAIVAAVDKSLSPIESLKASIAAAKSDFGGSVLSWLVQYAALLIGELLCFVGMLAGVPIAALVQAYSYRKLSGGFVAETTPPIYPAGMPPGPQLS